ncbi:hypothetical protein FA95DRAFT_1561426 [Auriscalpium vulgare]|uniref:Uncharacterized protein n=1 Tax=Auriscalpium vulgare TaxID=40419 RepID=A0ACB8RMM7_9AGAM|nr:hypothetical protein FA95DRAFT_1561426 [Auriscalpium vulgare]
MMITPRLPIEMQEEVVKAVYRNSQAHEIDYATLATCSLVCQSWRPVAQHLLFRRAPSPTATRPTTKHSFTYFILALIINHHLGRHVRSLTIDLYPNFKSRTDGYVAPDNLSVWLWIMRICRNVKQLTFVGPWLATVAKHGSNLYYFCDLDIKPATLNFVEVLQPVHARALLTIWPGVRCVSISGAEEIACLVPPLPWTAPVQLSRVEINVAALEGTGDATNLDAQTEDTDVAIRRLVAAPGKYWEWTAGDAGGVLAAQIKSLVTTAIPPMHILDRFVRLEELVFHVLPEEPFTLPASIRQVGYHAKLDIDSPRYNALVSHVVAAVAARRGGNLQVVTATMRTAKTVLSALEDACRSCGIAFVVHDEVEWFSCERNVDWV